MSQTILSTCWYVPTTSWRRWSHLGIICDASSPCQVGQIHWGTIWYLVTTSQIGQFYLDTSETLQQRLRQVRLTSVAVAASWWRFSMVRDVSTYMRPKQDVTTTSHAGWNVYYFKNVAIPLFWANLVPKPDVLQATLNLVHGYIVTCRLRLRHLFFHIFIKTETQNITLKYFSFNFWGKSPPL